MKTDLSRILALASVLFISGRTGYAATIINAVPFTITKAGNYALGSDLTYSGPGGTAAAITVNGNNVVLDLGGFSLYGTGFSDGQTAILISSLNVTVQNGNISSFETGVCETSAFLPSETGFLYVQNMRFFYNRYGVDLTGVNNSTIQNCFIEGLEPINLLNGGVYLSFCAAVVVKTCQISDAYLGCFSEGGGNSFIGNQLTNCTYGLDLASPDKYQGNVTVGCTYPFVNGTAVGWENN